MLFFKNKLKIDRLRSGGLITNYYCSSKCGHCLYNCSPGREKAYMDFKMAIGNLKAIRELGCFSVHIGGGEPMLDFKSLFKVLDAASKESIDIEYIETNSSWFKNQDSACDMLYSLKAAGVSTMLVSISPFHNEYIPFDKVKGVIAACEKTGMGVFPWIPSFIPDVDSFDSALTHSLDEYREFFGESYIEKLPYKYSLTMRARPLKTFERFYPKKSLEDILSRNKNGCGELDDVSHFHIDLYGGYIPGLCTGLSIKTEDLGRELSDDEYPFLCLLFKKGVNGLYERASKEFGFVSEKKYISKCDLCFDIRKYLVLEKRVDSKDLKPVEFYASI